jgi:hypothetical protein
VNIVEIDGPVRRPEQCTLWFAYSLLLWIELYQAAYLQHYGVEQCGVLVNSSVICLRTVSSSLYFLFFSTELLHMLVLYLIYYLRQLQKLPLLMNGPKP